MRDIPQKRVKTNQEKQKLYIKKKKMAKRASPRQTEKESRPRCNPCLLMQALNSNTSVHASRFSYPLVLFFK